MEQRLVFFLASFLLFLNPSTPAAYNASLIEGLDSLIRDSAFKTLRRGRTGIVYQVRVQVAENLSSTAEAAVVRYRSGSLWNQGANISFFTIPPGLLPTPYTRRLVIICEHFGNLSASYFPIHGYAHAVPVTGLFIYDATDADTRRLEFDLPGSPILIEFPSQLAGAKCVRFGPDGTAAHVFSARGRSGLCEAMGTGHFGMVVPVEMGAVPPVVVKRGGGGGGSGWRIWVAASVAGVVGLILLGLVAVGIFKLATIRRIEEMENENANGEELGTVWVASTKMPSATLTRTKPVLEHGNLP